MHALAENQATPTHPFRRYRDQATPVDAELPAPTENPGPVFVVEVSTLQRRYVSRGVFLVDVQELSESFLVFSDKLNVSAIGSDLDSAMDEFGEALDIQYRALVEDNDPEHLSPGARRIREFLLEAVSVEVL